MEEYTLDSYHSRLVARQRACEFINKLCGTEMWVKGDYEETPAPVVSLHRNEAEVFHG